MSDTDDLSSEDGPAYKVSSFLFGNVNKKGLIEEYEHDRDLSSINNLDRCQIREVQQTASVVILEHSTSAPSPGDNNDESSTHIQPVNYYDEQEPIDDGLLEQTLRDAKPEKIEEEDYDSPDVPLDSDVSGTTQQFVAVKLKEDDTTTGHCDSTTVATAVNSNINPVITSISDSSEFGINTELCTILKGDTMDQVDIKPRICTSTVDLSELINVSEDSSLIMPPPLHPAPISASRFGQVKVTTSLETSKSQEVPLPNTPLGNLMPPEYANVNIQDLFPSYNLGQTPIWSTLFKLPHKISFYRDFIEGCDRVKEILAQKSSRENRLHLIFDNALDLGEIPSKLDIDEHDDVVELNIPPDPNCDYLAGAEHSWWRRAFKAALANLEKHDFRQSTDDKSRNYDDADDGDKCAAATAKRNEADNNVESYLGWRLGPAKYWYDQLGLPLDIDISQWSEWQRIPTGNTLTTAHSASTTEVQADDSFVDDAADRQTTDEGVQDGNASLINTDESVSNRLGSSNQTNEFVSTHQNTSVLSDYAKSKSNCDGSIPANFYPYQLLNWEDDIIYDPQLNSNKISVTSRLNAAYAGWIPSQHCRTMTAFQDVYHTKFPHVISSKVMNGLTSGGTIMEHLFNSSKDFVHPNPPYAMFPVENQAILNDSWISDIIYDSTLASIHQPPPFLLTLDQNDETCLLQPIDDVQIVQAVSLARSQRQKRLIHRGQLDEAKTDDNRSKLDWSSEVDVSGEELASTGDGAAQSKSLHPSTNRTSLQVSFGMASTRGMFTGALAKTGKGAEKVKMILGKHGLLTEDDWQNSGGDQSLKMLNADDAVSASNQPCESNDGGADGTTLASAAAAVSGIPPKDPLNLSNDEYYALRSGALGEGGLARCGPLQHSTPAVELWPPFFPTFMSSLRLRQFHRVPLKRYLRGPMSQYNIPFAVTNLTRHIHRKMHEHEEEKAAMGGGEIFFMRTPADLSGSDGDVVLCEFSEEFPPLMAQIGMATRIINYYRPLVPRDRSLSPATGATNQPPELEYGSLVYVSSSDSPYLGVIRPGGCLQTVENKMFRAPIYPHQIPETDFLVIRNRNGISIRRISHIFTVGQQVPLMEVPGPNSKRANNFVRDFLQVFILRLFLRSTDEPKRIKMEETRKAFPNHSESSIRKRLKVCSDFKRTGADASWWVLRLDYRLPSEEEVRYLVSPEDCCAHYSMLASELRLKDAGYGEKSLFVLDENQEEEDDKEAQPKMEDEVRAAPWNTTRAYLASQRGGCFLELHGVADPTGCGEAFSYSKASAKPGALFRQAGGEVARGLLKGKRTVTGTDADLRKLHLRDARSLLRSFGISEADLKTFKRWEIIDMVRFTSTERAKQGEEEGSAKFARGNRLSIGEQIRCYRDECQRIFDLQNRVLSNRELLSSDEELSSDDEEEEGTTGAGGVGGGGGGGGGTLSKLNLAVASQSANCIGGVRYSSLSVSARSLAQVNRNIESVMWSNEAQQGGSATGDDRTKLKRPLESGESTLSAKRSRKASLMSSVEPIIESSSTSNAALTGGGLGRPTSSTMYEANATSAGVLLDLNAPWPNATKKMLRIMRTYSENGHQYTRTELVPWSPVVEIYLKIRQTRDDEFIHSFIDSDDQFKEQQRKEKRRLQDQLRRLRKQQQVIRDRDNSSGLGGGSLKSSMNMTNRRRRHKPLTSALIKMRCGACGQTGHMRTNKECPMYGRSPATPSAGPSRFKDRSTTALRRTGRLRSLRSEAASSDLVHSTKYSSGTSAPMDVIIDLNDNYPERKLLMTESMPDALAVAQAQALTSKPVSELLAEQDREDRQSAHRQTDASSREDDDPRSGFDLTRRRSARDSEEFDESGLVDENVMTVEGTKLKLHSGLTKYIKEQSRRNLKLKIRRQLLDRLDAAAAVVQTATSIKRSLLNRSARNRRTGSLGAYDDEFPISVKHRGNRRRIDPRVALNHIFEGIYKGLTQISGYKIFMHPVKEKDFPNYYDQIEDPMDLSQIRMKINRNSYATREEFLSDIRLIHNNSLKFNGRYSAYTETAMKMCSFVLEQFCHKELKLMRLESLVNPLLDEDDLVGLSYLLQQAIEAMRSVEHSRPFHTPVDKRRYPDYYKVIMNPMDLSTLEKMVKENRFHSRNEFFVQLDLILSNCIKFNGTESPLTEIAVKMIQMAKSSLEQNEETLATIESNIRSHMDVESASDAASTQPEASGLQLLSSSSSEVQPNRRKILKRQPSTSKDIESAAASSSSTAKKKPRLVDEQLATTDVVAQNKRRLRQRSSGAWYGVDLEYEDDDVDDDDDDDDSQAGQNKETGKVVVAQSDYFTNRKDWIHDDDDDDDDERQRMKDILDFESNVSARPDDDDERCASAGHASEYSKDFQSSLYHQLGDSNFSNPLFDVPTTQVKMSGLSEASSLSSDAEDETLRGHETTVADFEQSSSIDRCDSGDVYDDDDDDDQLMDYSKNDNLVYVDETACSEFPPSFSESVASHYRPESRDPQCSRLSDDELSAANDDIVAKDLRLTDSDETSSLSGHQGGELCSDSGDMALLSSSQHFEEYGSFASPKSQHDRKEMDQSQLHDDSKRVSFFISEDDE